MWTLVHSMSHYSRRVWILMVGLVLVIAACAPQGASPQPSASAGASTGTTAGRTIKIGVMAGFTGAIPVQAANTRRAAEIAVEVINARGGVQVGNQIHKVELATADDKCDPAEGQLAMDRLISVDKVDYLVGGLCSSAVIASLPIVARANTVFLVTNAASDQINRNIAQNSWKNIFHYSPSEISMNTTFAQFLAQQIKPKTLAILAEDTDPGRDAAAGITNYLAKNAPSVRILSTDYVRLNAGDMLSELTKIKASKPDVLFQQSTGVNSEAFAKQSREIGLQTIIASDAVELARTDFQQKYAEQLEGAFVNVRWAPAYSTPLTKSFLDTYKARANTDADFFALQQYDAMFVLFDAITRAGTLETGAVASALETTNLLGAMGTHSFEPLSNGHRGVWQIVISQLKGGKPFVVFPLGAAEAKPALPTWFTPAP